MSFQESRIQAFLAVISKLWEMWSCLDQLSMLVNWINPALTKLTISHQRQPLLQCCDSLMRWMKCPEFSAHTSMGKHLKNLQSPFPPSSLLPLLPWLPASCSWSWQPGSPQIQEGSTNRLSYISMAVEVPCLQATTDYPRGKQSSSREKRQDLKPCLIGRFIKTNIVWHDFLQLGPSKLNFPR